MSIRDLLSKISFLRKLYQQRPSFKAELARRKQLGDSILERNRQLFSTAFGEDLTVRYGPFAGMRYIARASGSQVLPKILGSYEEPIHSWINEIIKECRYDTILDVGCAEGYYAVGFARLIPNVRIYAFDIDADARERTLELATLNNVELQFTIGETCQADNLARLGGRKTLVFCDIEGGEDVLLDPVKSPSLRECGLLVEAHDVFIAGISDRLITRFSESHRIRMFVDYPTRLGSYDLAGALELSPEDQLHLTDECRPPGMRFLFMEPL
jgi:SAM-dependent methyltransferase